MHNKIQDKIDYDIYDPFLNLEGVKEVWTSMLKKCPHSYYLTWAWTEIWLRTLPPECNLSLIVGSKNNLSVIAFFLGSKITIRNRFLKFHQVSLNQTLIPDIDIIYVDYNAILIDPKITISMEQLLELIPIKSWDEFRMIRCSSIYQPNLVFDSKAYRKYEITAEKHLSFYVNLEEIRRNNNDYLVMLSQNRRQQIRRSIKEYEKMGDIHIKIANNVEEALQIFDELVDIHNNRWADHEFTGALTDEYIINFHKIMISERYKYGEIQLISISAGNNTLGCLYNLIYDGNVLFYLCGFSYLPGNLYRPGLVCHYYTILHNAKLGFYTYDFLEGEDPYKKSLSTDFNEMETVIIKKRGMKYILENIIVRLYRLLKKKKN
jgi:Acetyltransferase (GNAT) domain